MERLEKLAAILLSGCIVFTGCSSESKSKNKPVSSSSDNNKSSDKENTKSQEENKNNEDKEDNKNNEEKESQGKLNSEFQHNNTEARNLVNDIISFQVNSFDIGKDKYSRNIPAGFATLPSLSANVRKVDLDNFGTINILKLSEIVDVYNTYNRNVYNEEDVLDDIRKLFKANNTVFYSEIDDNTTSKSNDEIKNQLEKMGTVIYFKEDKTFAYNLPLGLGGAGFPQAAPEADWTVSGDSLEIPMISPIDNKITSRITLKINNKNYSGGSKKSYYYYYDVK